MPCPFYLESFGLMPESFLHPIGHFHASRHSQHLSPPFRAFLSFLRAQRVSKCLVAKEEVAPTSDGKKCSPAPINRLIPEERLRSRADTTCSGKLSAGMKRGEKRKRHVLYPLALTKPWGFVCLVSPALIKVK